MNASLEEGEWLIINEKLKTPSLIGPLAERSPGCWVKIRVKQRVTALIIAEFFPPACFLPYIFNNRICILFIKGANKSPIQVALFVIFHYSTNCLVFFFNIMFYILLGFISLSPALKQNAFGTQNSNSF